MSTNTLLWNFEYFFTTFEVLNRDFHQVAAKTVRKIIHFSKIFPTVGEPIFFYIILPMSTKRLSPRSRFNLEQEVASRVNGFRT